MNRQLNDLRERIARCNRGAFPWEYDELTRLLASREKGLLYAKDFYGQPTL